MTTIYGRRVIITTLDTIPPAFRTVPRYIAMNQKELDAFKAGESEAFKLITDICHAADAAEARNIFVRRRWKPKKRKSNPSDRMFLLNATFSRR